MANEIPDGELTGIYFTACHSSGPYVNCAAGRRALYDTGRQREAEDIAARLEQMVNPEHEIGCPACATWREAAREARRNLPEPLSCGCPPEHHDEAVRRLADRMRRDGVTTEGDR